MSKNKYICVVSGKPIPKERVEALKMLGVHESQWTCVEHSMIKPRQGVYLGEVGTSELLIVDKVYNDSVRSVFRGAKKEAEAVEEDLGDEETAEKETYDDKEMHYYNSNEEQMDPEEKIEIIRRQNL
jgi:hypothetical protein